MSERKGDLTIINVQVDDEHWYWCKASNRADEVEGKAYFEVQGMRLSMLAYSELMTNKL